jgi:hypothetical protein
MRIADSDDCPTIGQVNGLIAVTLVLLVALLGFAVYEAHELFNVQSSSVSPSLEK